MSYWIALVLAVAANVTANVALKLAARDLRLELSVPALMALTRNPWIWIGVFSAALLLGAYVYSIKGIDLPVAYSFVTGLALVILTLITPVLFGAALAWTDYLGMLLVVSGISLLTLAAD